MNKKRPLFSLIIPCHNPEKTIQRLFNSLTKQYIDNNDLEIIVVDDNSNNLEYRELLKTYGFNLIFTETNTDIHCPGNTRRAGMPFVHGHWLFFCDQDDFFEEGALLKIRDYIEQYKNETIYVISTIMRAYNPETDRCHQDFVHKTAWLHGKWYSVDNLIIPFNINFKKDLKSHEDIYFNSLVLSALYKVESDYHIFNIYTYRWVDNPDSITRKEVYTNQRGYLYDNFLDYLESAAEPYWEEAKNPKNIIFINQVMMTLLHAYFYYEAVSYNRGPTDYVDVIKLITNFIKRINNELNLDLDYIVNFIYDDPVKYNLVKSDCELATGPFIPKTSFRDFVYKLGNR